MEAWVDICGYVYQHLPTLGSIYVGEMSLWLCISCSAWEQQHFSKTSMLDRLLSGSQRQLWMKIHVMERVCWWCILICNFLTVCVDKDHYLHCPVLLLNFIAVDIISFALVAYHLLPLSLLIWELAWHVRNHKTGMFLNVATCLRQNRKCCLKV